jgi:hypothetical protein
MPDNLETDVGFTNAATAEPYVNPIDRPEDSEAVTVFYKSPLPVTSIQVLDTAEGVDVFLQHMKAAQIIQNRVDQNSMDIVVIGFDCEWKPMMR